jgi:hypothetical protein
MLNLLLIAFCHPKLSFEYIYTPVIFPVKRTVPSDMSNDMLLQKKSDMASDMSLYMSDVMTVDNLFGMPNSMSCYRSIDMNFDIH